MPLPEGYLLREGDVVVLHATINRDVRTDEEFASVTMRGRYSTTLVDLDKIVGIFARHFDVGDVVRSVGDQTGQTGEVVAVHEGMVWIKDGHGQMQTIAANELELASALDQPFVEPIKPPSMLPQYESPAKDFLVQTDPPLCLPDQETLDRIG